MRTQAAGLTLMGILVTSTVWAQDLHELSAPPTKVCQIGAYACPAHPEIQATWPGRCPLCQAVLAQVPPSAAMAVGLTAVAYWNDQRIRQGERGEELREQAQRAEEWRERYRHYGYAYPPYMHAYPPPGYHYFPTQGYYFNPNLGLYYFPNSGYFYSPRTGRYFFYNPDTGRYYPALPGYGYYPHEGY